MDLDARKRLLEKALAMIADNMLVAAPMEKFFNGNTDDGAFGRRMQTSREIAVAEYAEGLRAVRTRPEVHEVYVELREIPDDSEAEEQQMWPSGFVLFVITSATAAEVESWL